MVFLVREFIDKVLVYGREEDAPLWAGSGDFGAFVSLFLQNVTNMIIMSDLLQNPYVVGLSAETVNGQIIPAVAVSVFVGNACAWWQARRLARATNDQNVCALPFGINTPDLFAFVFNILAASTLSDSLSVGVCANFMSGVVMVVSAPFSRWIQKNVPEPGLHAPLAGIGLAWLTVGPFLRTFDAPMVAIVPFFALFLLESAGIDLPGKIPRLVFQWVLSVGMGWLCFAVGGRAAAGIEDGFLDLDCWLNTTAGYHYPHFFDFQSDTFAKGFSYLGVWLPLAFLAAAEVIINVHLAKSIEGEDFSPSSTLVYNGAAGIIGALLGAPFPTVTYIGHPTFKQIGGRSGYSMLNGICVLIFASFGGFEFLLTFVPLQAFYVIVAFIGIDILSACYEHTSDHHKFSLSFGIVPCIANLLWETLDSAASKLGVLDLSGEEAAQLRGDNIFLFGMLRLSQGFVLTSMLWASALFFAREQRAFACSFTFATLAALSFVGIIHSFQFKEECDSEATGARETYVSAEFIWDGVLPSSSNEALSYAILAVAALFAGYLKQRLVSNGKGPDSERKEMAEKKDDIDNARHQGDLCSPLLLAEDA